MPTWRESSASSKSIPPGPSEPRSIPSPRNATSTGSPAARAPSATTMLAGEDAADDRRRPSSTRHLGGPGRLRDGRR